MRCGKAAAAADRNVVFCKTIVCLNKIIELEWMMI